MITGATDIDITAEKGNKFHANISRDSTIMAYTSPIVAQETFKTSQVILHFNKLRDGLKVHTIFVFFN